MDKNIKISVEIAPLGWHEKINTILLFKGQSVSLKEVFEELAVAYGSWIMDQLTEDGQEHINRSLIFIVNGNMLNYSKKAQDCMIKENTDICILNVIDGG